MTLPQAINPNQTPTTTNDSAKISAKIATKMPSDRTAPMMFDRNYNHNPDEKLDEKLEENHAENHASQAMIQPMMNEKNLKLDEKNSNRPADLPEKFWDEANQQVRLQQLIKSYCQLEKEFRQQQNQLHQLKTEQTNFHNQQQQWQTERQQYQTQTQELQSELTAVDNFATNWRQERQALENWAIAHLGYDLTQELFKQRGSIALLRQLKSQTQPQHQTQMAQTQIWEPSLVRGSPHQNQMVTYADLRRLMQRADYWQPQNPKLRQQVANGFARLYGSA